MKKDYSQSKTTLLWHMKKKNSFLKHLSNYWIFHLLWIIFSVSAVLFEFNLIRKPKANEKIDFFVGALVKDEKEFSALLRNNQPKYLKKFRHRYVNPESTLFYQTFYTYGTTDADMYVIPETNLNNINTKDYFYALDEIRCEELFKKELSFYVAENGNNYGIKIDSPMFEETSDNIYVLFSKKSPHLGGLKNTNLDGDITIAKLFI